MAGCRSTTANRASKEKDEYEAGGRVAVAGVELRESSERVRRQ